MKVGFRETDEGTFLIMGDGKDIHEEYKLSAVDLWDKQPVMLCHLENGNKLLVNFGERKMWEFMEEEVKV